MSNPEEFTKYWRCPDFPNLELLHANYLTQRFAKHRHEGYAIGVIEQGALGFYYRGENLIAQPGMINLVVPDEPHTGQPVTDAGWSYRMFYFDAEILRHAAAEFRRHPDYLPFFTAGTINDPDLAGQIRRTHQIFEDKNTSRLERESGLVKMLAEFILRHADDHSGLPNIGNEPQVIKNVCDFMYEYFSDNLSLNQLARVAHLSPYHFLRVFQQARKMSPHAFLVQLRIEKAKSLLIQGETIAQAAYATGFTDQSHLNRHFKRIFGITPGQFSNFVQ